MRIPPLRAGVALTFMVLTLGLPALPRAAAGSDVGRRWLLSAQPLVVLEVEKPGQGLQRLLHYAALPELLRFPSYRELVDSTGQRRLRQLVGYLEKELGAPYPDLVERLAGGGIIFGLDLHYAHPFAASQPLATLQIRGRDPRFTEKVVALFLELGAQELARQESNQHYEYETFRGVKIARLGDDVAFAVIGSDLVVSNKVAGVKAAISRSNQPGTVPLRVLLARRRQQDQPLAWLWADLKKAKGLADENFKKTLELPTNDFLGHILVGGWLDVIRRADELFVALRAEGDDLILSATLPAGQDGMSAVMKSVFARPLNGPGARPLFDLPGTLYQNSFCFYPGGFIDHLPEFVTESVRKEFTDFDKKSKPFLVGHAFSDLVKLLGKRHQFIVARQLSTGYQTQPRDRLPAFAAVLELKDPARFDKQAVPIIRAAGFLTGLSTPMKFTEEAIGAHKLLGYRFVENAKNKENDHGFLFNFSPCMIRVGDQAIFSSTFELARDLLPAVQAQATASRGGEGDEASSRHRFSWEGLGYYFDGLKKQVVAQIVLSDGCTFAEAEEQLADLKKLFQRLGTIDAAVYYDRSAFRLELRTRMNTVGTAARK